MTSATSIAKTTPRGTSTRLATSALASAIASTDAIASAADDQVDPHSSANCTIDFVSSSMNPAPRQKKCHDHPPPPATARASQIAIAEIASTIASAAT